jgi:transposase-like protein
MYALGMRPRKIQGHLQEIYGVEASPSLISEVTDAVRSAGAPLARCPRIAPPHQP